MITHAISEQRELSEAPSVRVAKDRALTSPAEFSGGSNVSDPIAPERALAAGVLRQAASDLRRFRESEDTLGREMYSDARTWFTSDDTEWPYSFVNVCQALRLGPEEVREEVFADARSGWVSHSGRVAFATATQLMGSLSSLFLSHRNGALAVRHS